MPTIECSGCGLRSCDGQCFLDSPELEDADTGVTLADWIARNADVVAADRARHAILDLTVKQLTGDRWQVAA